MPDNISLSNSDIQSLKDSSLSYVNRMNTKRFVFNPAVGDTISVPLIGEFSQGLKVYAEKRAQTLTAGHTDFNVDFDFSKISFVYPPSIVVSVSTTDNATTFAGYKIVTSVDYAGDTQNSKCTVHGKLQGPVSKNNSINFDVNIVAIGL
jgi:hypothetical protein